MVTVADLLAGVTVAEVRGDPSATEVGAVVYDSRRAVHGALFCCIPGARSDGHAFAAAAVAQGAGSLLCERFLDLAVPQVRVAPGAVRPAMAEVASTFWGHPDRSLTTVGVTGTNGKTTVTHLVRAILEAAGRPTGVIGTLSGVRTTPEAPDLQEALAGLVAEGRSAVAMEVSSHALSQHRVEGMTFDVAAFTNLSRDHLDHHGTMEEYFAAKCRLFEPERARRAVVLVGTPWGDRLAGMVGDRLVAVRRGDATEVQPTVSGTSFRWRGRPVALPLAGAFNVDNALVAAAVADCLGIDPDTVVAGLAGAPPVPGRMEVVGADLPVSVVVDYAHTPEGLEVALEACRRLVGPGRVLCVFGCGGDRDPGKRPLMGAVAARLADVVVVTSDNPRSEDPAAIAAAVVAGIDGTPDGGPQVVLDRAEAIASAVAQARPGDLVLVAGKGHETSQTTGAGSVPFDDRQVATDALADRFGEAAR